MKKCSRCNKDKSSADYGNDKRNLDGKKSDCKECEAAKSREWRKANPEKTIELGRKSAKKWLESHPNEAKVNDKRQKLKQYNLTLEQFNALYEAQAGLCAICGLPEKQLHYRSHQVRLLSVDHNHATGKVRQLLCSRCNTTLGLIGEDTELLKEMISYIEKWA